MINYLESRLKDCECNADRNSVNKIPNNPVEVVIEDNDMVEDSGSDETPAVINVENSTSTENVVEMLSCIDADSFPYKCKLCNFKFDSLVNVNKHMNSHDEDGDWTCNKCSFQTNNKRNFTIHIESAHDLIVETIPVLSFRCKICDEAFENKADLNLHIRKNHPSFKPCKNFQEGSCKYEENCYFQHLKLDENTFICFTCGDKFDKKDGLMYHRKNMHKQKQCSKYQIGQCQLR